MSLIFENECHKVEYEDMCRLMSNRGKLDSYHRALAYLITLGDCRRHINALYDIEEDRIKPEGLEKFWQTSTSIKTTRLAFNLYTDHTLWEELEDGKICRCTPSEIFCSEYAPYYWQAIKLRYPQYSEI